MLYHKLEYGTVDNARHGRHLIFCAVSFDGVIISEGRYKFDRCFSLSCKICCYPLFQIRVKLSCHFDVSSYRYDTESKICAIAHSYVTLCARTAMFFPFDLAQIFQDHEDRCRELSRELHKL